MSFTFLKGHGTRNDFVVLPDHDGTVHADLDAGLVARLCDRRSGIGADGVLRVAPAAGGDGWFMDYRNADGSIAEMCGNGVRVFARYLRQAGLVSGDVPVDIETRGGTKRVTFCADGDLSVDMGPPRLGDAVTVTHGGTPHEALAVHMPNPHAVAFIDDLRAVGDLTRAPIACAEVFPEGVNVEFVERRGADEIAMRVYERGVGETQSCGTGACAAAVAAIRGAGLELPATLAVEVPGGRLEVTWDADDRVHLKGPAEIVATGTWTG